MSLQSVSEIYTDWSEMIVFETFMTTYEASGIFGAVAKLAWT